MEGLRDYRGWQILRDINEPDITEAAAYLRHIGKGYHLNIWFPFMKKDTETIYTRLNDKMLRITSWSPLGFTLKDLEKGASIGSIRAETERCSALQTLYWLDCLKFCLKHSTGILYEEDLLWEPIRKYLREGGQ